MKKSIKAIGITFAMLLLFSIMTKIVYAGDINTSGENATGTAATIGPSIIDPDDKK